MYEINHFRILILSASTFTEEKEKTAVVIRFLFRLVHSKEKKAEMFKAMLIFGSSAVFVYGVCVCTCMHTCMCVCLVMSNSLGSHGLWVSKDQAPLCIEFSRQESWSGLSFPTLGALPDPGVEPLSLGSPAFAGRFFTS